MAASREHFSEQLNSRSSSFSQRGKSKQLGSQRRALSESTASALALARSTHSDLAPPPTSSDLLAHSNPSQLPPSDLLAQPTHTEPIAKDHLDPSNPCRPSDRL